VPSRAPVLSSASLPGRGLRRLGVLAAALAVAAVAAVAYVAYEVVDFRSAYEGRLLPGAVVAGVDVGGLTPAEAAGAVGAVVAPQLERTITIRHGEATWTRTAGELGSDSNAEQALAAVVAANDQVAWRELYDLRWRGATLDVYEAVEVSHTGAGARDWVTEIARAVDTNPRDATLDTSTGWVEIVRGRYGVRTDVDATVVRVLAALDGNGDADVDLVTTELVPAVTSADFDQVLLVRHDDHRLYLYRDGVITHSWPVALGAAASGYPTPKGIYEVTLKRHSPTWINPDPAGWGKDMPAQIPPGPGNPLGERAINWSIGAIRFHGTADISSIGTDASKGCVRLTNPDVIQLFDLIDEGATIVSL
jgi:lipoprotein-anchoring transpeptidase ErfK/SrfK